jgi:predicted transglutaminase-like cysteine proteinase
LKIVLRALYLLGVWLALAPAAAAQPALFGTTEFRAASLAALPQWQRALRQIEAERSTYQACGDPDGDCPSRGAMAWRQMIRAQAGRSRLDQLGTVNRFLNDWRYKEDEKNYGRRDYWATPLEFFRHSGDCEDYAIVKYVTLREIGFPAEQLRLVVVQDVERDLAHAVLAVYEGDQVYILDNLTKAVVPQERLPQYVPYYSINENTRWAHVKPVEHLAGAESSGPKPAAP